MSTPNTAKMDEAKKSLDSMIEKSKETIEKLDRELIQLYKEYEAIASKPNAITKEIQAVINTEKQKLWIKLTDTRLNALEAKERLNQQINAAMYLALTEHGVSIHSLTTIILNVNTKVN